MGAAITGDGERTEEKKEVDPPHLRVPSNFLTMVATMAASCLNEAAAVSDRTTEELGWCNVVLRRIAAS